MATFLEIQTRVKELVNDPGLVDIIPALINQGVTEIAGGMLSTLGHFITPALPELLTIDVVTTDPAVAFVSMPSDFQRSMHFAVSASGREIDVANSLIEFTETSPALDKVGAINEVIEYGKRIYYLNIPSVAEALTLHYYRLPINMVADTDIPDGIPKHFHMSLLSNFAAWKAYEFIEDGLEDKFANTYKYRDFFFASLSVLELSIPDDSRGFQLR